jgi:hypothetical protein
MQILYPYSALYLPKRDRSAAAIFRFSQTCREEEGSKEEQQGRVVE